MAIKINKPGLDINGFPYDFLHVELDPFIELHYDRVSVNTKCYNGLDASQGLEGYWDVSTAILDPSVGPVDVSIWISPLQPILPEDWDRFNPIKIPFELEASTNLEEWAHEKCAEELTSTKAVPYEYMAYETDVFDLDPSTGEPILDPSTNEAIKLHSKGELIKKANGTYMFYTKILPIFCELEDVSINL